MPGTLAPRRDVAGVNPYPPISDYGLIGDCHTAALIARDSSVDWFCPGRFDAPAVFCRLLDAQRGGFLRSAPTEAFSVERRYQGQTNVLESVFSTTQGRVRATDLMPIYRRSAHRRGYDVGSSNRVLRLLEGLAGEVELELAFRPTFDYARATTRLELRPGAGAIATAAGAQWLTFGCRGIDLEPTGAGELRGRLRLRAGQRQWLVLTCVPDAAQAEQALAPTTYEQLLAGTLAYWRRWADDCTYRGPYREQVVRSALVLKLLTYEPTGALVAAPTTSLPEQVGGERNWDYRYTWLRDSSLILYALLTIGYLDEAADFRHWLEDTVASDTTAAPQIMYGIDGRRELPEQILDQLDGYRGSRPVRIGNGAAGQRQLDIYGAVLRSAALHYTRVSDASREGEPSGAGERRAAPSARDWQALRSLVEQAAAHWPEPDRGIWEVRGGPQPFVYGKLMCWSALDVGIRLARQHGLDAPLRHWQRSRAQVRAAILNQGYDRRLGAFVQAFGSSTLDASALMIPRVGFLPPTDPRVRSTVARIQQQLTRDGLVYRYRAPDGLAGDEGTFTLCSFWLANALALAGQLEEAQALFEQVLGQANDLGLLAEEIDPSTGEQVGNFPQGFSHMALIGAAVDLAGAAQHGAERTPQTEAERARRASRSAMGDNPVPGH